MAPNRRGTQGELLSFARDVIDVSVSDELGESFLAYSLSVITSRAIPDIKDGLKPVQRRIMYSMREMRLYPDRSHRKCVHVVGDVMAKFHPHGDGAIYDTLVRLGQSFAKQVPLIDPQGNFGSLDHPPAAYRYTECRLTEAALDLLGEIDEETVDMRPTYDGEMEEPVVLPAVLPNLLVNGTSGIAVGMATNMPPHNLVEVYEAIKLVMAKRRPKPTIEELMAAIPGPDFPTGAQIIDDGLADIYQTGRGSFRIRATAEIISVTRHRKGIAFTELPYLVGVERVMSKIKDLVNSGRLDGISDAKNLSDRKSGTRLVIECKTGVNTELLLQKLYRLTPLEETFGVNNVVLIDGVPTTVGLYDLCSHYIDHRLDVVVKRSQFRLRKAQDRLHIVEGLLIAIDNIDLVVRIIRTSANSGEARSRLMSELGLTEIQAEFVLELRLRRLTALAYDELIEEKKTLLLTIDALLKILGSEQRQRTIVIRELGEIADKYGRPRRSRIIGSDEVPDIAKLESAAVAEIETSDDPCVITLSTSGIIGRDSVGSSRSYRPGRHDVVAALVNTTLRTTIMAITSNGRVLSSTAGDIAEIGGRSRGKDASETFGADRGESIVGLFTPADGHILLVTSFGKAKRLELSVATSTTSGRPIMKLADRDRLVTAVATDEATEFVMVSSDAQVLRTTMDGVSVQGASAQGVAGMSLKGNAKVVAAGLVADGAAIVIITDTGTAKSTLVDEIPTKGRGTGGVRLTRFRDEKRIDYSWIGVPERTIAIVGSADAPTRPDSAPESFALRPTRRDGACSAISSRILNIGETRW